MNVIESKIAGLGFLQAIIARMANNSFYIKGWDLTLFVALVALKKMYHNIRAIYYLR